MVVIGERGKAGKVYSDGGGGVKGADTGLI